MGVALNLTVNRLPRDNNNSFTMIPNTILRDSSLSCKAKAVLMYLIGERDNSCEPTNEDDVWTLTVKGLTSAFKESVGAIRRSLDELMERGYLVRTDVLGENNLRIRSEYTVYEEPIDTDGKPVTVYESDFNNTTNTACEKAIEQEATKSAVEHAIFAEELKEDFNESEVDEIVDIITKTLLNRKATMWIGYALKQSSVIKNALLKLDEEDVARILHDISTVKIKNRNKYILKCLFEAGKNKTHLSSNNQDVIFTLTKIIKCIKFGEIDTIKHIYTSLDAYNKSAVRMYLYSNSELDDYCLAEIVK